MDSAGDRCDIPCSSGSDSKLTSPVPTRLYSASAQPDLKETFKKVLPAKRELLKRVKAQSNQKLGDVKVENALGGMR